MKSETNKWTKTELQTYILLLCANADSVESKKEIKLIKSKVEKKTFKTIYKEFIKDTEEERFQKIDETIHLHEYSNTELATFRKEINEVFFVDNEFAMMESNLNRILDNILY
tara:strand:+ start:3905 stop:4240 length:336 start_codon:yes stop_codon:yes gene_type:complete